LPDSVEVLFYGGLGGACYLGDLSVGEVVEVEEEEFLFVVGQLVDKVVEVFASRVGFFGEGVGEVLVKGYEFVTFFLFAFAQFHACGVEGYAVDPGGGVALAAEFRPSTPEVADDFLVEVVDVVGLAVGEGKAYFVQDATRTAQHLLEFCMSCLPTGHYIVFLVCFSIYVRCKNTKKVTPEMNFLYFFPTEEVTEHRSDTGRSLDLPYTQAVFE